MDLSIELGLSSPTLAAAFAERLNRESTCNTLAAFTQAIKKDCNGGHDQEQKAQDSSLLERTVPTRIMSEIIRREAGVCAVPSTPVEGNMRTERAQRELPESPPKQKRRICT